MIFSRASTSVEYPFLFFFEGVSFNLLKRISPSCLVEFILNSKITSINGSDKLESITVNEDKEIKVDGLFIAIGQEPKNDIFSNVVDLDDKGYIITHDDVYTKTEFIYVAGDTREKELRQLTTAVSDGSIAATIALKEMRG